jgi:hypothetical protein
MASFVIMMVNIPVNSSIKIKKVGEITKPVFADLWEIKTALNSKNMLDT